MFSDYILLIFRIYIEAVDSSIACGFNFRQHVSLLNFSSSPGRDGAGPPATQEKRTGEFMLVFKENEY